MDESLSPMDLTDEEIGIKNAISRKYKSALIALGVDLNRSDVSFALNECYYNFETIIQAFILWALYKERMNEALQSPSDALIKAIAEQWKPFKYNPWSDGILSDERFKSPGVKWWEAALKGLGRDLRNQLIADVVEDSDKGNYVLFRNGLTLRLSEALDWDWERIREYASREKGHYYPNI